jgi:hypothetical protein
MTQARTDWAENGDSGAVARARHPVAVILTSRVQMFGNIISLNADKRRVASDMQEKSYAERRTKKRLQIGNPGVMR